MLNPVISAFIGRIQGLYSISTFNLWWTWQVHSTGISWNRHCQRRCWWAFEAANQLWPPQSSRRGLAETLHTISGQCGKHLDAWLFCFIRMWNMHNHLYRFMQISCSSLSAWCLVLSKENVYTYPYHCTFSLISSGSQLVLSDDDWWSQINEVEIIRGNEEMYFSLEQRDGMTAAVMSAV